jgi:glutamine synthetase
MLHVDLCENLKKHLLGVQALGEEFTTSYVEVQMEQWRSYSRHLSQWELDNTLDC